MNDLDTAYRNMMKVVGNNDADVSMARYFNILYVVW